MKKLPTLLVITGFSACLLAAYLLHTTYADQPSPSVATMPSSASVMTTPAVPATQRIAAGVTRDNTGNIVNAAPSADESDAVPTMDFAEMNPDYPTLDHRLAEMQARRNGENFDADKVKAVLAMESPWNEDASLASAFSGEDASQEDGRAFIRYEPLRIEALMPGDEISLPIPQESQEFRMVVETVETHGDGVITWRGHLKDFTEQNQVTISQANGNTQMGIFTPDSHYQVEIFGNQGWVVNSGNLFKGGDVVINVTDGVEGPATHHGEHGETSVQHSENL